MQMDPDSYCNIVPDGVFIKNMTDCAAWQMCWNGTLVTGTCPSGYLFDATKGICDYADNVICSIDADDNQQEEPQAELMCNGESGIFVAATNCNGYYYCLPSLNDTINLIYGECPGNRFFNASNGGSCVPRTQIVCNYSRCAGMGYDHLEMANLSNDGCVGFSVCENGVEIGKGSCLDGEYFNELTQVCSTEVVNFPACASSGTDMISTTTTTSTGLTDSDSNDNSTEASITESDILN